MYARSQSAGTADCNFSSSQINERRNKNQTANYSLPFERETAKKCLPPTPNSPTFLSSTMQQSNHFPGQSRQRRNRQRPAIVIQPGQVAFRVVCHDSIIPSLIGPSGSVISTIRLETSCIIHCEERVPTSNHRVVLVVGSCVPERRISFKSGEDGEVEEEKLVSRPQVAVVRVLERMWEVGKELEGDDNGDSEGYCGLLANTTQIGVVARHLQRMRRESGAHIRILPAPHCAARDDELIQITGGILAVKRAVFAVTGCLKDCSPYDKDTVLFTRSIERASSRDSSDPHSELFPHLSSFLPPLARDSSSAFSSSIDADGDPGQEKKATQLEVSFRLLCFNSAAGSIIGNRGTIVRALQNETGASIMFAAPTTSAYRVITISALENLESCYSPAQNAVIRVFARSIEYDIEQGRPSGLIKGTAVTAKLLVAYDDVCCLRGKGGLIDLETIEVTGADIQVLEGGQVLDGASQNDVVVQITGEYKNVQNALFQVTGKLRDNLLPSELLNEVRGKSPYESGKEISSPELQQSARDRASSRDSSDSHSELFPHLSSLLPPLTQDSSSACSSSIEADGDPGQERKATQLEVSFRLLCSNSAAGSIIGKRGTIVRALQNETGASIMFAAPTTSAYRVITISAIENLESCYSPAKNAVICVFARSIEYDIKQGHPSGLIRGTAVTANLLVAYDDVCCLGGKRGTIDSEMIEVRGADIQVLEGGQVLDGASQNDVVVQITGEYKNVQNALFEVTGKLRDNLLPSELLNEVRAKSPYESMKEISSPELQQSASLSLDSNQETSLTRRTSPLALSKSMGHAPSPELQWQQKLGRGAAIATTDNQSSSTTCGGSELERLLHFLLPKEVPNEGARSANRGESRTTCLGLHFKFDLSTDSIQEVTLTKENDLHGLSDSKVGTSSPELQLPQTVGRHNKMASTDSKRGSTNLGGSVQLESRKNSAIVANATVELIVSEDIIGCICGEGGGNLDRIRQISGAKVEVRDPFQGESEGIVIISGRLDQISAAQSLLQAFIQDT